MDDFNLKESHPQKYYLKKWCKAIYYMGLGDCWYERTERSKTHKFFYAVWAATINGYIILNTLNEILANVRTDLTVKEQNDVLQFTFAHPCLSAKYIFMFFQKDRIRVLLERLLEGRRVVYISPKVEKESVKKALFFTAAIVVVTYVTVFLSVVDGVVTYMKSGIPIRTEVVLYPTREQSGVLINVLRFFVELHWWCIVTNMTLVDGLSCFSMVFVGYKFSSVGVYFKDLKQKIKKNREKGVAHMTKEFEKDFIVGIKLHEETLWCAKNVQYALGNVYSVQVVESIALLVMCLVKLVTVERNLSFMLANCQYIVCLLVLTGVYFTAAGDVSYEAAEVSTAIFNCGWELVPMKPSLRTLVVVAIQRSLVPVYMTAFGVIILSHNNYILVLRASYSFFAVTY